ncbi:alpha/beta fold hydrolase [Agromyces laixinhei]|uniref:alpha/beta fold hydrolase n=1 Tax=Agromyces laixinhei TaxID=2585717 RepID=UPI0011175069|nr:alpha/beta fold hydrolase [Agromyces laixinhei]
MTTQRETSDILHVIQDGSPDAPALVLVHGTGASGRSWDALVPRLAGVHRVIRPDLLGHGCSPVPASGDYGITDQAWWLARTLDHIGIEQAVLIGHSTGGAVATALAELRPEIISALTLINTGPHVNAYIAPDLAIDRAQWPELSDAQIRQAMTSAFSRPDFEVPQQMVDDVRAVSFDAFVGTTRASLAYLAERPLPERLTRLGMSLMVVFGAEDRRWRSSSAADYRAVPGAEVRLLPGIGHTPIVEEPAAIESLILPFVAAHAMPTVSAGD